MTKYEIWNKDFRKLNVQVDTMFADPPDCIGLKYDEYDDNMEVEEYIDFINEVLEFGLRSAKTTYMSFNAKWMSQVGALLEAFKVINPTLEVRWLIQGFTFGQNRTTDHTNNFRPIVRLRYPDSPLFPDAIRRESWRMKNGDKRANPAGKVPGDVWFTDFLEYARVTGNSKQRRPFHPTQLHEGLVEDCLTMSTPVGGLVMDPFMGTGTTLRVSLDNGWSCVTSDVSQGYCERVAEEHGFKKVKNGWTKTVS
jgi:site-specific DNA-methyltransferase (adenine-specific)